MSDLYKFGYTLDETIETMRDVIDTGNHDRMFLDTYYWLKMLSEYREIGTVEECREAVEKQKPKKPVLRNDNGKLRKSCPVCGCFFSPLSRSCPKCGQAIDTENLEGMEDEEN